jgi:retron-type reverse transcriptase
VPTWSDKLLQEVIRLILEAYFEPQFSDRSHGFRPGRGCHTALQEIYHQWHGTVWFIEGDITDCYGSLDHSIMRSVLAEKIHDGRFLHLIDGLLQAGYLEDWRYHRTLSGCPQGGVVSPVLSNIYLDRLDRHIEQTLLPAHNWGERRTPYRPYMRLWQRAYRLEQRGNRQAGLVLRKRMKTMPSRDPNDPGYRRLRYCRYADDWLLGFAGPRQEAEQIKADIAAFLHDQLHLELSATKTVITHGRTQPARFLGYQITVLHADDKHDRRGHRSINAAIGLKVPVDVIPAKCTPYLHRTHRRYRLQYRRAVPSRVPGRRGVLPAGVQPSPARQAEVRHGTVADQDPGPQVSDQGPAGLPPLPRRPSDRARSTQRPSSHRAP